MLKIIKEQIIKNIINSITWRDILMISSGGLGCFGYLTESINNNAPFSYALIIFIWVTYIYNSIKEIKKNLSTLISQKQRIQTINEEDINFSSITPYCNMKHAIVNIGVRLEIINSSTEKVYCSVDPDTTTFSINNKENKEKIISPCILIQPYSCPKTFNCLERNITDIEVRKNPFSLKFHIELNFYKNKDEQLFTKKCHYEAECIFVQDAVERHKTYLEIRSVVCNQIPEIEFTTVSKS